MPSNKERLLNELAVWKRDQHQFPVSMQALADRIIAANLVAPEWHPVTEPFDERIRYMVWDGLIVEDAYFGYAPLKLTDQTEERRDEKLWRNTYTDLPCKYPITHICKLPQPPKESL